MRYTPKAPTDAVTGLEAARFGLYVHFPFCLSKCPYCDFASVVAKDAPQERYTKAILAELAMRSAQLKGRELHSVYFGGGTPSLWAPKHVATVLVAIRETFALAEGTEVTLEANPGAADSERFAAYREAGVNRLSMGVQSLNPKTLRALGREHSPDEAISALRRAREAGIENLSLDFIYGVQQQSVDEARADALAAAQLGAEHVSAYALTLEREALAEDVPLAKQLARGEVELPPDEEVVQMQRGYQAAFAGAGLARYEVSNYSLSGFHSRHNTLYWTGGEYLALGVGATGTVGHSRFSNQRSWEKYLGEVEAGRLPSATVEPLDDATLRRERLAMGLRLVSGVDLARAGASPDEALLSKLVSHRLAVREGTRLKLTEEGLDVHSAIAAQLI
jgi:oxygen-independent coproporphyrinogen-3 oxidase